MNKKKILTASLASAAVLGAGFLATQTSVVNAERPMPGVHVDKSEDGPVVGIDDILKTGVENGTIAKPKPNSTGPQRIGAPTKPAETPKPAPAEKPEFTGGVNAADAPINNVPELGNVDKLKLEAEIAQLKEQIKDGEENGAEAYQIEGLKARLADLEEALAGLAANKPAVNEVPEFTGGVNAADAPVNEVPEYKLPAAPATPANRPAAPAQGSATAGTSQDNTYQAPAAKEEAKEEAKQELPNTGGKESAALASVGFLGLVLGALPFAKRKN